MTRFERLSLRELVDVWILASILIVVTLAVGSSLPTTVRLLLAVPSLFFAPGYAITTLLFPTQHGVQQPKNTLGEGTQGIKYWERAAIAFGTSISVLPLLGILLSILSIPITPRTGIVTVSTVTFVALAGGVLRRSQYSTERRYQPPTTLFHSPGGTWVDRALTGGLVVVVVGAVVIFAFVVSTPAEPATYTEASLLTEGPNGELVAEGYPTDIGSREASPLVLTVTNHEKEVVTYHVVVQTQELSNEQTPTVISRDRHPTGSENNTVVQTLADGETWRYDHALTPVRNGDNQRIVYLIYRGEPPEQPAISNSYRHLLLSPTDANSMTVDTAS